MSEKSGDLAESCIVGPDFFGFYTSEVTELLSQDEGLLPFPHRTSHLAGNLHEVGREKGSIKNSCRTQENNGISGSASLFSNGIGALVSEFKRERLKSLLRQSVLTLTHEVDEMINPVLSVCRIRSCLRCKEHLPSFDASAHKADQLQHPRKKMKVFPTCSELESKNECGPRYAKNMTNDSAMKSDIEAGKESVEMDDDLRFLLENDSTKVEELLKKHSGELSATLTYMERKLEELLDITMTSCRPMTLAEKQHLRKMIQKLHPRNLGRVVEIIRRNKPSDKYASDQVRVDLDEQDNITLWRLYFYVKAIQPMKADKDNKC